MPGIVKIIPSNGKMANMGRAQRGGEHTVTDIDREGTQANAAEIQGIPITLSFRVPTVLLDDAPVVIIRRVHCR